MKATQNENLLYCCVIACRCFCKPICNGCSENTLQKYSYRFRSIHTTPKIVILHENGTLLKPPSATAWESFQLLTITFEWTIVTDKMIWIKIKTDTIYFSSLSLTSIGFFFHYIFIIYICVWCMSYQSLASCNTISNMFS